MEKRPALGKGLSALIPDTPEPRPAVTTDVDIDRLAPNTFQPRAQFDDARLDELARSIKSNGVIQPIVVQRLGDRFQIIAGERRWRAAQKAGLQRVPIVVREASNGQSLLEMALIENIQREDLNADRRGAGLSPTGRRVPDDAGGHRHGGWKGPGHRRQHPPAPQTAGRSPGGSGGWRAVDGSCPGLAVPAVGDGPTARLARRPGPQAVGQRDGNHCQEIS